MFNAQITVFAIFAVSLALAASGESSGDPFTGHCAKSCQSVKSGKNLPDKRDQQAGSNNMPSIFVEKVIRKYSSYAGCMNDCMCAAYCTVLEELADWSVESCAPVCRKARPYTTGDKFFKDMENSLAA